MRDLSESEAVNQRGGRQWGTIGLVGAGSMLEFYEFQTFVMFTLIIGNTFFSHDQPPWLRQLEAFSLLSIGFIFRPVAGAIVGQIGDRVGRKASFLVTILLMALPTLGIGLLPGYAQIGVAAPIVLLLLRILQGMASAGELSGAAVFVTESARADQVGLASGALYGAIHVGYFLAALMVLALNAVMPSTAVQAYGWRLAFILGGLLGFVALWARRRLHESPEFEAVKARRASMPRTPLGQVLRGSWGRVFTVMLLGGYVGVSIALVYSYAPAVLQTQYKIPAATMSGIIAASFLFLSGSALAWGRLADRIGLRTVIIIGCGLVVSISLVFGIAHSAVLHSVPLLAIFYFAMSIALGSVGCAFAIAASQFPTEFRLTGLGLSYNLGLAVFLGTAPFVLALFPKEYGGAPIIGYLWAAAAVGLLAALRASPLPQKTFAT